VHCKTHEFSSSEKFVANMINFFEILTISQPWLDIYLHELQVPCIRRIQESNQQRLAKTNFYDDKHPRTLWGCFK
jgi:hypothetical protein